METKTTQQEYTTNKKPERKLLTGMFTARENAERSYDTLRKRGYFKDDISMIMSSDTRKKQFSYQNNKTGISKAKDIGATTFISDVESKPEDITTAIDINLVIPNWGLIVVGPILTELSGFGASSISKGLIGMLIRIGIPEYWAKLYEKGAKNGQIVMGVHLHNDEDIKFFESNWRRNKGKEIYS